MRPTPTYTLLLVYLSKSSISDDILSPTLGLSGSQPSHSTGHGHGPRRHKSDDPFSHSNSTTTWIGVGVHGGPTRSLAGQSGSGEKARQGPHGRRSLTRSSASRPAGARGGQQHSTSPALAGCPSTTAQEIQVTLPDIVALPKQDPISIIITLVRIHNW